MKVPILAVLLLLAPVLRADDGFNGDELKKTLEDMKKLRIDGIEKPLDAAKEWKPAPPPESPEKRGPRAEKVKAPLKERVAAAIGEGSDFLIRSQQEDGSWTVGSWARDTGFEDNHVKVGVTAYGVFALEKIGKASGSVKRGRRFIMEHGLSSDRGNAKTSFMLTRSYALTFGLLAALDEKDAGERAEKYSAAIEKHMDSGTRSRPPELQYTLFGSNGGTFQVAMLALSVLEAKERTWGVPRKLVNDLLDLLETARQPDGNFNYYTGGGGGETEAGAVSRGIVAEYALYKGGRGDRTKVLAAIERFYKHHAALKDFAAREATEQIEMPHVGKDNWARYYYLFGVYWCARALSDPDFKGEPAAPVYARNLSEDLISIRLADGSWVDSGRFGGPNYGTASAILSLDAFRRLY